MSLIFPHNELSSVFLLTLRDDSVEGLAPDNLMEKPRPTDPSGGEGCCEEMRHDVGKQRRKKTAR